MKKLVFNARLLRAVLVILILCIAGVGIGIYVHFSKQIDNYALEVSRISVDATASENRIAQLQQLDKSLQEYTSVRARASEIVAERESYHYQDQVVQDINRYAVRNGIQLSSIDFIQTAKGKSGNTAVSPTSSSAATASPAVNTTTVSITPTNPIIYERFMGFVHDIEMSLTRMQIASLTLTRDQSGAGLSTGAITLEVYIK